MANSPQKDVLDKQDAGLTRSMRKKLRNQEILMQIASGAKKEDVCSQWKLGLRQLNRIISEATEEAEEWFRLLPRQAMIQIFRYNCDKIFCEINRLEEIREREAKKDNKLEFEMTRGIINAYSQYNKLVAEGPSLIRQKEVTEKAEQLLLRKKI
jgi:hypothetical protein